VLALQLLKLLMMTGMLSYESGTYIWMKLTICFLENHTTRFRPRHTLHKMHGRKIYEFALTTVPAAMKSCLDKSGIAIDDVKKILIINEKKMDKQSYSVFINYTTDHSRHYADEHK
jgi:3-oxoacyl-[acyl-carrier-protein] synthase-3